MDAAHSDARRSGPAFRLAAAPATPGERAKAAPGSRKLIVISPHWEGIRKEFGNAFSEWTSARFGHPTEFEWIDMGGTSDALRYVRSEFKRTPDGIGIDLFFGGGVDPYMQLAREDLLAVCELPDEVLGAIPPTFAGMEVYDPRKRWFGAALAGFGIIYNREVLNYLKLPEPQTWADLGDPRFFSWVGSGDPRSSGSVHMVYEIILQAHGWDQGWGHIMRMAGNIRGFARAGSSTPKDTALGEVACGLAIDVYAWRQIAEVGGDRMGFCLPRGLTAINPDGIGILRGAPEAALAAEFVRFVVSEPGQRLLIQKRGTPGGPREFELGRMSILPGLPAKYAESAAITYDPHGWEMGFVYDPDKGGRRWTIVNDLLGAAVIDTHAELAAAWRAVLHLPAADPRRRSFEAPPISEAEIMALAAGAWNDAEARNRGRSRWANEARRRYQELAGATPGTVATNNSGDKQ